MKNKREAAGEPDSRKQYDFTEEAIYLVNSYPQLVKNRVFLLARLAGDWTFTKDMAIAELDNLSVSYGGEHVQGSGISNPTERIAMKLTDEYLARRQADYLLERENCVRELEYTEWKIAMIESVMNERMDEMQRPVFRLIYLHHKTFKEVEKIYRESLHRRKAALYDCDIIRIKEAILTHFKTELEWRSSLGEDREMMHRLIEEVRDEREYHKEQWGGFC